MFSRDNKMEFSEWLVDELKQRGWTNADLANTAGISRGSVTNIISGMRSPGTDICERIARAFKIPPEVVYRRAGLLPPEPEPDEKRQELMHLFGMMSAENRDDTIDYARMKLEKQERENKKDGKRARAV
jgi:transcriptional regulator with XRE-family HTH domain